MNNIRKYLSEEVRKQIKKDTPQLLPSVRSIIEKYITHHYAWIGIVLFTFALFFAGHFINIDLLNIIHVNENNVRPMVESRTTNIVAMISISFAIVGFLISNLAVKGTKSYSILFRRSFFLPITFFSLTLMGSFIALTALKDHLETETLVQILYLGIYLILIDILFIGFLFTRLVVFTNSKELYKMVCKDLFEESKARILDWAIKEKSKAILNSVLDNSDPWDKLPGQAVKSDKSIIKDINLKKLRIILAKHANTQDCKISHNFIYLGKNINNDKVLFNCYSNRPELFKKLNTTVILTKHAKETTSETREYLNREIQRLIVADDYRSVEQLLAEYANIAQLSHFENVLIDEFLNDISTFIHKAVTSNAYESFMKIDGFIVNVLVTAINEKRIQIFIRFLGITKYYYTVAAIGNTKRNKTADLSRDFSARRIREVIAYINLLLDEEENIEKIKSLNNFAYWGYTHFGNLLYHNIHNNDHTGFSFSCNQFDNIRLGRWSNSFGDLPYELRNMTEGIKLDMYILKKHSAFYHFSCAIGIKYWLYWCYYNGKTDVENLKTFLQDVKADSHYRTPLLWEMELLFSKLNSIWGIQAFNWGRWELEESQKEGAVYSLPSPLEWIFFGYAVDLVRMNGLPIGENLDLSLWGVKDQTNKQMLITTLLDSLKKIEQSIEKWNKLSDSPGLSVKHTREQLEKMQNDITVEQIRAVAKEKISEDKVAEFVTKMQEAWTDQGVDESRLGLFDIIDFTNDTTTVKQKLPQKTLLKISIQGGKVSFIDGKYGVNDSSNVLSSFITDFKERLKTDLLHTIIKSKRFILINNDWDKFSKSLRKFYQKGCIVITDPFTASELTKRFAKLDIKITNNPILKSSIIVANMAAAFDIKMSEDANGNILNIEILTVSQEIARTTYNNNPDYWNKGGELTEENAILKIMNGVIVNMEAYWDIKIKDKKAFAIYYLKQ